MRMPNLSASLPINAPAAFSDRLFYGLVAVGFLLNATGLYPDILEPDGALYSVLAKRIAETGDWVDLVVQNQDWLDKPHFPFWITALSFKLLGINSVAYKLPALLFFGAGVAYTYEFARLAYPKLVAQLATLIVLTPYHLVLSNNDVRAEPYLLALVIGSVYHFFRVDQGEGAKDMLLGSLLAGCALMTKGPFVLVPIGGGLVIHWLLTGQVRELWRPRWWLAVILTLLFTLPELICLYLQFDLHPEKVVFGKTGVSGIRFFFWDSQFGRFFNTGPIKGAGDPLFFTHTLLWAFLPWSLPLYASIGRALVRLARRQPDLPEYISLGSGLATFALFSLSGFQLPHYLNIVYPFFAVLTAQFLVSLRRDSLRNWTRVQTVIGLLAVGLALMIVLWMQLPSLALIWLALTTALTYTIFRGSDLRALTGRMVGAAVAVFGLFNLFIFPEVLPYQPGMEAAFFLNKMAPSAEIGLYEAETYKDRSYSFEFHLKRPIHFWTDSTLRQQATRQPVVVFIPRPLADSLTGKGFLVKSVATFDHFHVSQLTPAFLNPATRKSVTDPYVVAEVQAR